MTYELGQGTGPLKGIKVVEIAGIGPSPHACMILADLGADVIRVERPGGQMLTGGPHDLLNRGRPSVALNLKDPEAIATVLDLVAEADVLVEGMRPGTTERLGLGPDECLARNPRLVYGRMTGWGQDGPLAKAAGHDMNYIAITGALFGMGQDRAGRTSRPTSSATSGAVRRTSSSGSSPRSSSPGSAARGRSSMPRSSTAPPTSTRWRRGCSPAGTCGRSGGPTCSTAGCRSTTSTRPLTAGTCRSARWSRSSTRCS